MISDKTLCDVSDWALVPDVGLSRAMALELIDLRKRVADLEEACEDALVALAALPDDAIGYGNDGETSWPLKLELRDKIRAALGVSE